MNKQITLSTFSDELANVRTKKKEFLDRIVPWGKWVEEIRPCYYKGERGNKPYDLELMLRIYVLQNLYDLSDMGTVAEVIDSRAFSEFCGVDSSNQVPDGDILALGCIHPAGHVTAAIDLIWSGTPAGIAALRAVRGCSRHPASGGCRNP